MKIFCFFSNRCFQRSKGQKFLNMEHGDLSFFLVAGGKYMGKSGAKAWAEDKLARQRGRVQIFNSTRPYGMDGWTMDRGEVKLEVWAFLVFV